MEINGNNVIAMDRGCGRPRNHRRFCYPHEVVQDPQLSVEQKRAILSDWASDRRAVESFPALRHLPGTPIPVTFSSIMDARLRLDEAVCDQENHDEPPPKSPGALRHKAGGSGLAAA